MEIERAVENADAVIVCLSNNSVSKEGYVQRELKFVLDIALEKPEGTIFIIPVRLENIQLPRRLRSWQSVDYFPSPIRSFSNLRIIASLKKRAEGVSIQNISNASIDDDIAIEICIFDRSGNKTDDFWFITRPDLKMDELFLNIKVNRLDELPSELGDYKIEMELPLHRSMNDLRIDNGTLLSIRLK